MDINNYVVPIVLVICLCVGFILKHLVRGERINKLIPLIVALIGILVAVWEAGWELSPDTIATGLVSGLASTGSYEGYKGIKKLVTELFSDKNE